MKLRASDWMTAPALKQATYAMVNSAQFGKLQGDHVAGLYARDHEPRRQTAAASSTSP